MKNGRHIFRGWMAAALCLLLAFLCPRVLADADGSGFSVTGEAQGLSLSGLTASGERVEAVENPDGGNMFPGSVALSVTLTETEEGSEYLLRVVGAEGDTLFVDQCAGGEACSFIVAFPLPEQPAELTLWLSSSEPGFTAQSVPLFYAPPTATEAETETETEETPQPQESCEGGEDCPLRAFTDLDSGAWYHDGIHFALVRGIMAGVGNGEFAPGRPTSRAMLVTMLWRMEGMPASEIAVTFSDVADSAWYADSIRWAASEGIVGGYGDDRFGPDDNLSREQLVTILCRYAQRAGADTGIGDDDALTAFTDAAEVSPWAADAMRWAVRAELISGVGDGMLSPKTDANRAQVAAVLMRGSTIFGS